MDPGMVSAYPAMMIIRTRRTGIRTLLIFSIPFSTPNMTTMTHNAAKSRNQITGLSKMPGREQEMKLPKNPDSAATEPLPTANSAKYFMTHPPMTQ